MNYKAIDILKTLSKDELENCRLFMHSKYLNRSLKVAKLYDSLISFHPDFDCSKLTEENLCKEVSPHLKYNKSSMKNLFADLAEALEKYFILEELSGRKYEYNDLLREAFFNRKLWKYLVRNIKNSERDLNSSNELGTDYFIHNYKVSTDKLNYLSTNKPKSGEGYFKEFNEISDERAKYIAGFFAKEMIRQYENLQANNRALREDHNDGFIKHLFETVDFEKLTVFLQNKSNGKLYSKLFGIYNAMFLCYSDIENAENYYRYKKLVMANIKSLSEDEVRFHLIRFVSYCMMKIETTEQNDIFDKELFNVYSFILKNKYYKFRFAQYMPVEFYRTIILQSLKLKKFDFALNIINGYKKELHPERRENMHLYACALYSFHSGNFEQALGHCQRVKLNHFALKSDLKILMLMICYELGLESGARSIIDSFRHFVSKNEILSQAERRKHKAFIDVIAKLFLLKQTGNLAYGYELKKLLESDLPNKKWVEEKLLDLKVIKKKAVKK